MFFESPVFWALLGVVLVIAEVFTLSFVLVFFGAAAIVVAGLTAEGTVRGSQNSSPGFRLCPSLPSSR